MLYDRFLSFLRRLDKRRKIFSALVCALVIVPIMLISCYDNSSNTAWPTPFFAVKKEAPNFNTYPTALFEGKLVLDNNCLRLKPSWDTGESKGSFPVWPYGYSLRIVGKQIQVIDKSKDSYIVAIVGDKIKVGGGEVSAEFVEDYIGQQLPDDCPGPYWLVSPY